MRVLNDDVDVEGFPKPKVFANHPDDDGQMAMSTDWNKYCSPEATKNRTTRRIPEHYGVIRLNVGGVEDIPEQEVVHAPVFNNPEKPTEPNNRGHTNVLGPKGKRETRRSNEIRTRFIALLQDDKAHQGWVIHPMHQGSTTARS